MFLGAALSVLVLVCYVDPPGGNYVNIDVMFRIYGDIPTAAIASRAVLAENPADPWCCAT
jgi:hypothetical protein